MDFRRRVFAGLDRIFGFEGAGAPPSSFNPGGTSWVYDLRRAAELGSIETDRRCAGFLQSNEEHVHAAGGTVETNVDPYATSLLQSTWGNDQSRWVWLLWHGLSADVSAFTTANVCLNIPTVGLAMKVGELLLGSWGSLVQVNSAAFDFIGFNPRNGANVDLGDMPRLPIWIPQGATLGVRTVSTGACTIRYQSILWVGPIGVLPPGMA